MEPNLALLLDFLTNTNRTNLHCVRVDGENKQKPYKPLTIFFTSCCYCLSSLYDSANSRQSAQTAATVVDTTGISLGDKQG